eukprot:4422724-Amphidinium_carterae.1
MATTTVGVATVVNSGKRDAGHLDTFATSMDFEDKFTMLHAPPPAKAMPMQQSQLVTDVFDKHFRQIESMSPNQVVDKLKELKDTLPIDVFYKVASVFEMNSEDFKPHPQALQEEETAHVQGVVQVENKKEAVTGAVAGTGSASSVDRPRLKPRPPVPSAP